MNKRLMVHVFSFSYHKSGMPKDETGHGGGFVFDCRFLPNPGREEAYKELDGRDIRVKAFLEARPEIGTFWVHLRSIVDSAVEAFRERGFTDITVAFGCTGGQHRSVYFAERTFNHLTERGHTVRLNHNDLGEESS